jgi:hypothetical protein
MNAEPVADELEPAPDYDAIAAVLIAASERLDGAE